MIYRSSLSFITLHWFLAKLRALDFVNFSDQTVFQIFLLNASRYWPDFWHVSQSPWFTDQVWVLLPSIDFWWNYGPWTWYTSAIKQFSWLFFWTRAAIDLFFGMEVNHHVLQIMLEFCYAPLIYWPWNLVNFSDQTVFQSFFLNACRYWPDFWHESQSPWFTDQLWVSLRSIVFWPNYGPWT